MKDWHYIILIVAIICATCLANTWIQYNTGATPDCTEKGDK